MSAAGSLRARAVEAMKDERVVRAVRLATLHKVDARAAALADLGDADGLRDLAAHIKQAAIDDLPALLRRFSAQVEARGGIVHFAPTAADATRIICGIATGAGARLAVKSKSMTSEEVHLNAALEAAGVTVVETDLGEFIVQIDHDAPSHIVTPIIHKDRGQIARAMQRALGCEYTEDPRALTEIARRHLRDVFRRCDLGISGVNFAAADTGTLCICTNEGNGRMTVTRPRVHVALLGIEKLIPRLADLPVFLKLLARSSTGQKSTVYTTLITGPRRATDADGPESLHVVLLDNGRSNLLGTPDAEVLRCIRCGACLNACPVYRSIGGHAYASVYPGPIGSLITPMLAGRERHAEMPRASSLCGACGDACPVRIDIPRMLVRLREQTHARQPAAKRWGMRVWRWIVRSPLRFRLAQRLFAAAFGAEARGWLSRGAGPLGEWTRERDLPAPAARPFRRIWEQELRDGD